MRTALPLSLVVVLLALPGALALDNVVIEAPDVYVGVEGRTVGFDSATAVGAPVGVATSVTIEDVAVDVDGLRCMVDPNVADSGVKAAPDKVCEGGTVTTTASAESLQADVDLRLPEAAPAAAPEDPAPAETEAALVAPIEARQTVMLAAAAAGASLLTLYGAWRVLKWTGLAALIPLYSHIRDDEILDDANRAAIYRLIQAEPGISTKDVADRLGLAWGTVTHHLGKLEKRRFVVSKKYGKYRRYFANGEGGTEKKDEVAVLRLDRTGDVAALIRANPGVTQKAVSAALGVSSSTILWHVKRLEEVHLVTKVREGKIVRYYPGEGMSNVALISGVGGTAA